MNDYENWLQRANLAEAPSTPVCDRCKAPLFDASGCIVRDHEYCARCKRTHCSECWHTVSYAFSDADGCTSTHGVWSYYREGNPYMTYGRRRPKPKPETTTYSASVLICPQEGGYYAYVPKLPDCASQGDTVEEATEHITAAFTGMIEGYLADGVEIPWQVSLPVHLEGAFATRIFINI